MNWTALPVIAATALGVISTPARADDCAQVDAAMKGAATTPYSSVITRTDMQGHPVTSRFVQTSTTKYVEVHDKWMAMSISSKDLLDTLNEQRKTAKMTCGRVGSGPVNGQTATVYAVHTENQGTVSDSKLWISGQNLLLKSEIGVGGKQYVVVYDYSHVDPPKDATPVGVR